MKKTWITSLTVSTGLELEIEVGPWTNVQRLIARGAKEEITSKFIAPKVLEHTSFLVPTEFHYASIS